MALHAQQDVGELIDRVHLVGFARRDERVEAGQVLAGPVVPDEEEVLAPERRDAERALRGVIVDGQMRVGEEERQRVPLADHVADGLADRAPRWMPWLLGVEPRLEVVHDGFARRLPHLEVLVRAEEIRVQRGTLDLV